MFEGWKFAEVDCFVREIFRVAANGDQLGNDADRNFLRRESANLQAYRGVHAVKFFERFALFFEGLIDG